MKVPAGWPHALYILPLPAADRSNVQQSVFSMASVYDVFISHCGKDCKLTMLSC
jgi:hypothetical protein